MKQQGYQSEVTTIRRVTTVLTSMVMVRLATGSSERNWQEMIATVMMMKLMMRMKVKKMKEKQTGSNQRLIRGQCAR